MLFSYIIYTSFYNNDCPLSRIKMICKMIFIYKSIDLIITISENYYSNFPLFIYFHIINNVWREFQRHL